MRSTVYFTDLRATAKENFVKKIGRLLETAGLADCAHKRDLVAVKLHFGEWGNSAFIRPVFLGKIVDHVRRIGATPFLTDANTLYAGTRGDAPAHLVTALRNGFAYSVVNAPLIIADGLRGKSETAIKIGQKRFDTVFIAAEIAEADALVSVAHFKGHELSGFGGTIKNLGMGCASRKGKLAQHSSVSPRVSQDKCVGCGECVMHCSQSALELVERAPVDASRATAGANGRKNAVIDAERCIGCGECILICPNGAIDIAWNQSIPVFLENMVEYTLGVLKGKSQKSIFLNFLTDVSPACDCCSHNDSPIVRDIGVLAARDPVAIDQAAVDLVNQQPALADCCLTANRAPGEDKFSGLYPDVDWKIQLDYAQLLGLGRRDYRLEKI